MKDNGPKIRKICRDLQAAIQRAEEIQKKMELLQHFNNPDTPEMHQWVASNRA